MVGHGRGQIAPPVASLLGLSHLVALQKPNGGIRGLVIGDVLRRLVAPACRSSGRSMAPRRTMCGTMQKATPTPSNKPRVANRAIHSCPHCVVSASMPRWRQCSSNCPMRPFSHCWMMCMQLSQSTVCALPCLGLIAAPLVSPRPCAPQPRQNPRSECGGPGPTQYQ